MELKEFIKQTLIDVVEGVKSANEPYSKDRKEIYEKFELTGEFPSQGMNERKWGTFIDFDIAVIVNETQGSSAKAGIGVALANLVSGGVSAEKQVKQSDENTHRLKFKVFVSKK